MNLCTLTLNFCVRVVDEYAQGWKTLFDDLNGGRRVFVSAQVGDGPRDIAEEADGVRLVDQLQQRLDEAVGDDLSLIHI